MSKVRSITPLPPADFTPEMGNYKDLQPFRFWCQKVLPLVYDDSLSYYELLCKVIDYLNKSMEDVGVLHNDVTNLHEAYVELQEYVNTYFSSLDVQEEVNNKLDQMVKDGTLDTIINEKIFGELNKRVTTLEEYNKKCDRYILISDSYGLTPSTDDNWMNDFKKLLTKGETCYSNAANGSGFIGIGEGRETFKSQLEKLDIKDKETITKIIVVGGYNDATALKTGSTNKDLREAITEFCRTAKNLYPNAIIYLGTCAWTCDASVIQQHRNIRGMINTYYQSSFLYENCRYIGGMETLLHFDGYLDASKYHPNSIGSVLISNAVINALSGLKPITPTFDGIIPINFKKTCTWEVEVTDIKGMITDNLVSCFIQNITMTGNVNLERARFTEIGELTNNIMWGGDTATEGYRYLGIVATEDGNYHEMCFYIYQGKLFARALKSDIETTRLSTFDLFFQGDAML